MIKILFHKSFSAILALLVLFSTVSFTIEKHFCGDILVDVSMFTEADKCAMETQDIIEKKSCCKDVVEFIEGQDELKVSSFKDIDFIQQQFFTAFACCYVNLFKGLAKQIIPHKDYSPPNLIADIQVLDQVFLI